MVAFMGKRCKTSMLIGGHDEGGVFALYSSKGTYAFWADIRDGEHRILLEDPNRTTAVTFEDGGVGFETWSAWSISLIDDALLVDDPDEEESETPQ